MGTLSTFDISEAISGEEVAVDRAGKVLRPALPCRLQFISRSPVIVTIWNTNTSTIEIELERGMQVTGWMTLSAKPNDDNVGIGVATDEILPH